MKTNIPFSNPSTLTLQIITKMIRAFMFPEKDKNVIKGKFKLK